MSWHITDSITLFSDQESISSCMADCEKVLPCTHKCKFKCLDCSYGQLHLPCEDNCVRTLICGHKCQGKCGEACQPCSRLKCLFQSCHHKKGPFTYFTKNKRNEIHILEILYLVKQSLNKKGRTFVWAASKIVSFLSAMSLRLYFQGFKILPSFSI